MHPASPDPQPEQRVFLGWHRPALPAVADWLLERFGKEQSAVTVVTPAARAGRRLQTLLLDRQPVIAPPRILSPAQFLDHWTQHAVPRPSNTPRTTPLDEALAWISVLRDFAGIDPTQTHQQPSDAPSRLAALVPQPPGPDDWAGWWALAARLTRLRDHLATGRRTMADAAEHAAGSADRWAVLAALERAYLATLEQHQKTDRQAARLHALQNPDALDWPADRPVVLAALADHTPLQSAVFGRCPTLHSLVFADARHADDFDDQGGLIADRWTQQPIDLPDSALRVVDQATDEPQAVAHAVADLAETWNQTHDQPLDAHRITVGLANEMQGTAIVRALRAAGGSARSAVARPFHQTAPFTLLSALARLHQTQRFDALAELVRHPDLESFLDPDPDSDIVTHTGRQAWQTLLDRWATRTLQTQLIFDDLHDHQTAKPLADVYRRIQSLIPASPHETRPLPQWSEPIQQALENLYAHRTFQPNAPRDAETLQALEALGIALIEQQQLPKHRPDLPQLTAAAAIQWTLARIAHRPAADPPTAGDIEAMGLLDAALDDAPALVLASVNDGFLPGSLHDDTADLLPDALRTTLGLPDANQRLARDAHLLQAIAHSRSHLALLAARTGPQGEPLKPSRLWLQSQDANQTAQRLLRFYNQPIPQPGSDQNPSDHGTNPRPWLQPGSTNQFIIPRPQPNPIPDTLHVTAFRTYLACPYRFYLKHILKLRPLHDAHPELDPMSFGILVHDTLAALGQAPPHIQTTHDPQSIQAFLAQALDQRAAQRFGPKPRPAVQIQLTFAHERLAAFAPLQANWNQQGWTIHHVEHDAQTQANLNDHTFHIQGRIDRIDHHPELGLRVIDFKTGDTAPDPMKSHVTQRNQNGLPQRLWLDLQLPLYRDLIQSTTEDPQQAIQLGYVVLPRKTQDTAWKPFEADTEFWQQAREQRDAVLAGILAQDFAPALDPPRYADEFSPIAADQWPLRNADLERWANPTFIPNHPRKNQDSPAAQHA